MRTRPTGRWLLGFLILVAGGVDSGIALAGSGNVVVLPKGRRNRTGLTLQVDTRWVDGNGYRPVRLRVYPALGGKATADRRIEVTITPRSWRNSIRLTSTTAGLELQQGATSAETTVAIPCSELWSSIDVSTSEDGGRLDDLSSDYMHLPSRGYYMWSEGYPSIVFIDSDAPEHLKSGAARSIPKDPPGKLPDFRALAGSLPNNYWSGNLNQNAFDTTEQASDAALMRLVPDLSRLEILPARSMPKKWIELTGVDLIFISLSDLREMVDEYGEQWAAIRSWLATGPALCVYDVGTDFERLAELESILQIPELDGTGALRGWSPPDREHFGKFAFDKHLFPQPTLQTLQTTPAKQAEAPKQLPFVVRTVEQGRLVAFWEADPFPGNRELWHWLLQSIEKQRWMWYQRHGMSLQRENNEYWNLLIPGVGQAPVKSFVVLITLFVIVIGPVNYFLLRRRSRLYLLLVTVPVGAACVTIGLLCYALLTDGLSVRSRMRSLTAIDQRSGRIVSASRQTYYAGLSPSSGLVFPSDAAVLPVDFRPQTRVSSRGRRTVWGDRQHLVGGSFPSRSTVQFLVTESRPTGLAVVVGDRVDNGLPVTNQLGVEIRRLVVRHSDGRYYAAGPLPPARLATLPEVQREDEARFWNSLFTSARPAYPAGFDPFQLENAADIFGFNYYSGSDGGLDAPSFRTNPLESGIRSAAAQDLALMPLRSYICEVVASPDVAVGIEGRQQASFHVVYGNW